MRTIAAAMGATMLATAPGLALAQDGAGASLYRYVDPMIGTGNDNHGDTVPGPTLPAGSIHPSPQTLTGSNAGYDAQAPISGFAQLHTQGSGGKTTYGTFLVSPQTGTPELDEPRHLSPKRDEVAAADAYAVTLTRYGIRAEVTPAAHSALYRFTYPTGAGGSLVFDVTRKIGGELASAGADVTLLPAEGRIVGRVRAKNYWSPAKVDIWFVAQLDRKPTAWGVRAGQDRREGAVNAAVPADTPLAAWWQFDTATPVEMRLAVSFTSAERAAELLDQDMRGATFASVRAAAQGAWDRELNRITIDGVGAADRRRFYTALYHSVVQPRDRAQDQAAPDRATPHWDDYYTLWDTYHTGFPLMSLLRPSVYAANIASIVQTQERYGAAHTAFIAGRNYHGGQGGDEVDNVLGEGLIRGVPGVDWAQAAKVALRNAYHGRSARYQVSGWFGVGDISPDAAPDKDRARSGSSTPAFALNDFYAARLAAAAGRADDAAMLLNRSGSWRNVWNEGAASDGYTGFIVPRHADGRFQQIDLKQGWNGTSYDNVGFYEGSSWSYSYTMLHDVDGMIRAMGGRARFVDRLEHALGRDLIDITNEPSFSTPWLFSDAGRPDLTSYWANRIFARFTPDAYPGDEDNGAMSSHYVFNRIGLFPKLTTDLFYLHAPHQPRATIRLEDGKTFAIVARNWSPGAIYIRSARLNGVPLDTPFLRQADIRAGGKLDLELSRRPTGWARAAETR